jgi:hypothetical protein
MPQDDLAQRAKTMRYLRDDARERGPKLRRVALFYARETLRLSTEQLKKIVKGKRDAS